MKEREGGRGTEAERDQGREVEHTHTHTETETNTQRDTQRDIERQWGHGVRKVGLNLVS